MSMITEQVEELREEADFIIETLDMQYPTTIGVAKIMKRAADTIEQLAAKARPKTGYWVEENINEWSRKVFCSECGCPPPFEHISNGDIYSASGYGVNNKTKFCPNCGARMERSDKECR